MSGDRHLGGVTASEENLKLARQAVLQAARDLETWKAVKKHHAGRAVRLSLSVADDALIARVMDLIAAQDAVDEERVVTS